MTDPCIDPGAESAAHLATELPEGHVVRTFMEEHQRILSHLDRLEELVGETPDGGTPEGRGRLEEIQGIAAHLIGAEPHHQREEQVLFPALEQRGVSGPPAVMTAEHVELRALKHAVADRTAEVRDGDAAQWATLRREALALVELLREHIGKEDTVLYPMALRVIRDGTEWAELRRRCDAIGYCCQGH